MYQIINDPISKMPLTIKKDDFFIPCDEANADYQDFLAWVASGNTAQEWQPEDAD